MSLLTGPLTGPECASWLSRLPHRGNFREGRHPLQADGSTLEVARFTGYAFIYSGSLISGVQLYMLGNVIGTAFENFVGAEATRQLTLQSANLEIETRRATRPQVLAALAALAGQASTRFENVTAEQLAALRTQMAAGFTGLVGLLRAPDRLVAVYAYYEGRPIEAEVPAPAPEESLIQFSSTGVAADGEAVRERPITPPLVTGQVSEPPPPPPAPSVAEPVAVPAASGIDVERLWLAALAVYSSELGPAGVGAVNKLRASVKTATPQVQLDTVRQRISAALGAQAIATFERQFGG